MIKKFYDYQENDIKSIFDMIEGGKVKKILYQLPTGGGKTVVFSEIAKRFMQQRGQKVTILTHRKELCKQTSTTLLHMGVDNAIFNSNSTSMQSERQCQVAMVETLKKRAKQEREAMKNVGLVIIDEAHHNSFTKLFKSFKHAVIIGVTATPFSSEVAKPMKRHYDALVVGESISNLIATGFLAKPNTFKYPVELNTLTSGVHGDYTVRSSNALYSSQPMLDLLLSTYKKQSQGKKTLIFNNGIQTSLEVYAAFTAAGIAIRHLDNKTSKDDRKKTLKWFKKTKDAVLTSVSILTTGFDEPTVQTVILNRATTSITLYHQMIGRGARKLPSKKSFTIIDLGNNVDRFGAWEEPVDWKYAFEHPEAFAQQLQVQLSASTSVNSTTLTSEVRSHFPKTVELSFDVEAHFQEALDLHKKHKSVIQESIRQHTRICLENAETVSQALSLSQILLPEIEWRVKQYVKCLENASKNYKEWLIEDYVRRLSTMIRRLAH